METLSAQIPEDWSAPPFTAATPRWPGSDPTEPEVGRALKILKPRWDERVLDLACGSGRRSLALRRRGFDVVGVDISAS
jgi:2-polyprenyl-3-methyl-5-hydroxy-6-metoxy-1,4-benzoquinol methylase